LLETDLAVVNIHQAKTHLSRLVERAAAGEEIVIAKSGKPIARLVPFTDDRSPRLPGSMRGRIRVAEDFDAPLPPEILAGFTGES
jgi:prevent-host-death family protein